MRNPSIVQKVLHQRRQEPIDFQFIIYKPEYKECPRRMSNAITAGKTGVSEQSLQRDRVRVGEFEYRASENDWQGQRVRSSKNDGARTAG